MPPQRNAPQRDLHQYHRERETLARRDGYLMSSERGGSSRRENPRHAHRRKAAAARRLQPRPSRSRANPAQSAASRPHASATSIHAAPPPHSARRLTDVASTESRRASSDNARNSRASRGLPRQACGARPARPSASRSSVARPDARSRPLRTRRPSSSSCSSSRTRSAMHFIMWRNRSFRSA